jgi:hypothetical protein
MACSGCGKSHAAQRSGKWHLATRMFEGEVHVAPSGVVKAAPGAVAGFIGKPFTHLLMWIGAQQGNNLIARRIP